MLILSVWLESMVSPDSREGFEMMGIIFYYIITKKNLEWLLTSSTPTCLSDQYKVRSYVLRIGLQRD